MQRTNDVVPEPHTILVVEDTPIAREPLLRLLRHEGFTAVGVANGKEALDALPVHRPDLVLLDVLMPVMNGIEFLSLVRADERWKDLPVIVLTALENPAYRAELEPLGVKAFLLKTAFEFSDFLKTVREHLPGG